MEAIVDALAVALGWDERNTRALNLATQAAQALVELAARLPADLAPTIFQVPTLLSDEQWRERVVPFLAPATRQFFTSRFARLPAEAITPVTNIIDRMRAARPVAALLGSPASTFSARAAMDGGGRSCWPARAAVAPATGWSPTCSSTRGCPKARRTLNGGPSRLVRSGWERSGR